MESNRTYIDILIHTLQKKVQVLDDVVISTNEQENLLTKSNSMDLDEFNRIIEEKGNLIEQINELNDGFERLYERIKEELINKKAEYSTEIKQLQDLITIVTEKSLKIQAMEKQNYIKFQQFSKTKSAEIKEYKQSSKTVTSYYKNMAGQHQGQSYFIDKKN